jgi:hypothetical protein
MARLCKFPPLNQVQVSAAHLFKNVDSPPGFGRKYLLRMESTMCRWCFGKMNLVLMGGERRLLFKEEKKYACIIWTEHNSRVF